MRYYRKYLNTKKLQEHISHTSDFDREIFNLKVFTERLWKHKMMQKPGFKVTAKKKREFDQVLS